LINSTDVYDSDEDDDDSYDDLPDIIKDTYLMTRWFFQQR